MEQALMNAITARNITVMKPSGKKSALDLSSLEPCHPAAVGKRVRLEEDGSLTWPVMFLYPEYGETDFVQEFHEETT